MGLCIEANSHRSIVELTSQCSQSAKQEANEHLKEEWGEGVSGEITTRKDVSGEITTKRMADIPCSNTHKHIKCERDNVLDIGYLCVSKTEIAPNLTQSTQSHTYCRIKQAI